MCLILQCKEIIHNIAGRRKILANLTFICICKTCRMSWVQSSNPSCDNTFSTLALFTHFYLLDSTFFNFSQWRRKNYIQIIDSLTFMTHSIKLSTFLTHKKAFLSYLFFPKAKLSSHDMKRIFDNLTDVTKYLTSMIWDFISFLLMQQNFTTLTDMYWRLFFVFFYGRSVGVLF